ncbi:hypothetical protein NX059_012249 [Plenodomus lindquistii]|nr:hypothetical protein NX059_012249 [Plenodomus lindquistii]
MLKDDGLTNYRCKTRPELTRAHDLSRLKWRREYNRNFAWGKYTLKFLDECSFERVFGQKLEWAFRYNYGKWKLNIIHESATRKGPVQMIWGAI